jgi:membrane protein implicated in regulation of membrane protease activity
LTYAGLLILCAFGWRWYQRARPLVTDQPNLNRRGSQYLGQRFRLVTPTVNGRGRIEVGDSSWVVAGPELPVGRIVEVTGADGVVLQVRAAAPERDPQELVEEHRRVSA